MDTRNHWRGAVLAAACAMAAALGPAGPAAAQDADGGQVLDAESGKPLAGVTVTFRGTEQHSEVSWHGGKLWGSETGDDGGFMIPDGARGGECIAVDLATGCSAWTQVPKTGGLVLKLVAGNVIEGVVRAAADGPGIPGVSVVLAPPGEDWWHNGPQLVTDQDGKYRVAGIPPGMALQAGVETSPRIRRLRTASKAVTFTGVGEQASRDLLVEERPGVSITFRFQAPEGTVVPKRFLVTHVTVTRDELREGEGGGGSSSSAGGDGEATTVVSTVAGGKLQTHTTATRWRTLQGSPPALQVYFPAGDNELRVKAGALAAAFPKRVVAGRGDPETHTLVLKRQARVVLQLVDGDGRPLPIAGVSISIQQSTQSAGSMSSTGVGGGATDAQGRLELTGRLSAPGDPAAGTKITIGLSCSGQGLSFPKGAGFTWSPAQLRALLKSPGEDGIVWLKVTAVRPVAAVLRFVDESGAALSDTQINGWVGGSSVRGRTDADGTLATQLPPGTHTGVRFQLGQGLEMDPLTVQVPSEGPITVKVRRVLLQMVPVDITGVPPKHGINVGAATIRALDAGGAEVTPAMANVSPYQGKWAIFIRAPGATRKLEITFRTQTLTVDVPDGTPVQVPLWTVP